MPLTVPFAHFTHRLLKALPARPPIRGEHRVPGLRSDVQVTYTDAGIPHLRAASAADLFFAQGYLTAADRLFQMDVTRRTARGELAEIIGAHPAPWRELSVVFRDRSLVDVDHFMRQLGLVDVARVSIEGLPPTSRAYVEAYALGVNAYMHQGDRPLECQLLGYQPRPWSAIDAAVLWKALAFQLSYGWRAGLTAEALRARFPNDPDKARALLPDQRDVHDAVLPLWLGAAGALTTLEEITGEAGPSGLGGSNAWAIAPSRTKNGRAILCGDPHLPLRIPSAGYLIHLSGGGFDVAGWSIPGMPGILLGHNDAFAWSFTTGSILDATWAMEQLSADGTEVRTSRGFVPLEVESVDIFVRGEKRPVTRRLRSSPNGPVFDGSLLGEAPEGFAPALRWTGHLPTPDLDAVLALNRARDFASVRESVAKVSAPAMNLVFADRAGHIGWQLFGAAPRFKGRPPLGAVPGWSDAHEWAGIEPFESMPHVLDPTQGFIVSANQKLLPTGHAIQLGELFEPPYRARRIRSRLESIRAVTLDEAIAIQQDQLSGFGVEVRDRFLVPLSRRLAVQRTPAQVLKLATAWDGFATPDSAGAAAFWAFMQALVRELFVPVLGDRLFHAIFETGNLAMLPLVRVLAAGGAPFMTQEGLDARAREALVTAGKSLVKTCGQSPATWQLGRLRPLLLKHAFSEAPLLGGVCTLSSPSAGGDGSTVNKAWARLSGDGAVEIGPVLRHAVECGDWDNYRAIIAGGEGGDPTTARYREMFDQWCNGEMVVLPFTAAAIQRAATGSATLKASAGPG